MSFLGSRNGFVRLGAARPRDEGGGLSPAAAYRLAMFGDSRVGGSGAVSGGNLTSSRIVGPLTARAQDLAVWFNGGISGSQASGWASSTRGDANMNPLWDPSAKTMRQSVAALGAAGADVCVIQFGINDIIGGASAATVAGYLTALIDAITDADIPVVFVSIEPANDVAGSFVTGASSSGGYGENAAAKAQATAEANRIVRDHIEANVPLARYVNTHDMLLDPERILGTTGDGDPYGYVDTDYMADGTHMRAAGCWATSPLILAAVRQFCPKRYAPIPVPGSGPALILSDFGTFTNGLGEQVSIFASGGTVNRANSQTTVDGKPAQQCIATPSALSGDLAGVQIDILPPIAGASPEIPVQAGDVIQASMRILIDDGAGGTPTGLRLPTLRQRYFFDDASNIYSDGFHSNYSNDVTPLTALAEGPIDIRLSTNPLTVTKDSANILATSPGPPQFRLVVDTTTLVAFRVRVVEPSLQIIARAE